MGRQLAIFGLRWGVNTFGLWLAVRVFGTGFSESQLTAGFWGFVLAGLIFSIINGVLKPIITILSLPFIVVTLGLFTVIINGFMVYIALAMAPGIHMTFWNAVLTGIVLSLVNYIVSGLLDMRYEKLRKEKV